MASFTSLCGRYTQLAVNTVEVTSGLGYLPEDSLDGGQLFNFWLQASKEAATNQLLYDKNNLNIESCPKLDLYIEHCKEARRKGYIFDSVYRILRPIFYGVDACLDNLTAVKAAVEEKCTGGADVWFTFKPFADNTVAHASASPQFGSMKTRTSSNPQKQEKIMKCWNNFSVQVISMETRRNIETVSLLSRYLIRRYIDRFASSIGVLYISDRVTDIVADTKIIEHPDGSLQLRIVSIPVSPTLGQVVNHFLNSFSQQGECMDLIFLYSGGDSIEEFIGNYISNSRFRMFIPAYPIHVSQNLLILTPIQLLQFNGCRNICVDTASIYVSMLTRISITLGAVLRPTSDSETSEYDSTCMYEEVAHAEDREWFTSGIHSVRRESWIADGRMVWILQSKKKDSSTSLSSKIEREPPSVQGAGMIGRHVTYCNHGWCSGDTRTLLLTAIRHYRPRCVLELGTWYGKSSRFILKHLSNISEEDNLHRTLFCVDKFKNNAVYNSLRTEILPEDKMFFNFLRYESFFSSVEDVALQNPNVEKNCSVCAVKMDIHESLETMHSLAVPIDMVFIDAEKKTYALTQLILKIRRKFPNAVIVGDDFIFESVQNALQRLEKQGVSAHKRNESYLIPPANSTSSSSSSSSSNSNSNSSSSSNWRVKRTTIPTIPVAPHSYKGATATVSSSAFRAVVEQAAEAEVAVDCGIHEVGGVVADLVYQGRTSELRALLFHPQCPLFKVYISGQPSLAHSFMTHYMKLRRQLDDEQKSEGSLGGVWKADANDHTTRPDSALNVPTWTPEVQSEMREIALRIVDSITEDNMSYSEGMLSIFDLIFHPIVFQ